MAAQDRLAALARRALLGGASSSPTQTAIPRGAVARRRDARRRGREHQRPLDRPIVQVRPRVLNRLQLAETLGTEVVHGARIVRLGRVHTELPVEQRPRERAGHPQGRRSRSACVVNGRLGQRGKGAFLRAPPCLIL